MADPTFVSIASGFTFVTSSPFAIATPSGYAAGDVLLACANMTDGSGIYNVNGVEPVDPAWATAGTLFYGDGVNIDGLKLFYKYATGSEGASEDFSVFDPSDLDQTYRHTMVAIRLAANGSYLVTGADILTPGDLTSPSYSALVTDMVVAFFGSDNYTAKDAGSTLRSASLSSPVPVVLTKLTGPGTTAGLTLFGSATPPGVLAIGIRPANSKPYTPNLTSMADGGNVDVAAVNRSYHTFDDPDDDLARPEGQSRQDRRYRAIGAPTWTTINKPGNTNLFYDYEIGVDGFTGFTDGVDYEHQAQVYDLAGEPSGWSGSGHFTGAAAPAAPPISAPVLDATITTLTAHLVWTSTETMYRVRKVADNAGSPDPTIIYYDSGPVLSATVHDVVLTFPVNDRTEHLQVQIFDGFLWSPWSSRRVHVDYVEPPSPTFTVSTDVLTGSLVIEYDTPAPVGAQPTPDHVDIWIDDGGDIGDERKVEGLAVDGVWSFMTPRSGRDYAGSIRCISYTVDGIPSV